FTCINTHIQTQVVQHRSGSTVILEADQGTGSNLLRTEFKPEERAAAKIVLPGIIEQYIRNAVQVGQGSDVIDHIQLERSLVTDPRIIDRQVEKQPLISFVGSVFDLPVGTQVGSHR